MALVPPGGACWLVGHAVACGPNQNAASPSRSKASGQVLATQGRGHEACAAENRNLVLAPGVLQSLWVGLRRHEMGEFTQHPIFWPATEVLTG